jgi:hypothetical protein
MQKSSEMTRWTHPTNEAFYALHKSAMGLFDTVKLIARIVWIIFSTAYLQKLLSENAPFLGNASFAVAVAVLVFLHYFGNELLRYTAYNNLDNDPNTVNTPANYIILALVYVGLLGLDIKGTTSYFDESPKFEQLENLNEGEQKAAVANRQQTYNSDLKVLTDSYELDIEKLRGDSASAVAKAKKSVAVYDAADQKKLNRNISTAKTEAHRIIDKQAELAAEQRKLLTAKNTDIATITQKHTTKGTKINMEGAENKTGAEQKGWIISLLCLGIVVFCTIQGVKLRIKAGQKPVSRFTINDATGSVTEKLFDAAEDIWQRAAHQAIDKVHSALTIKELDALDGAFSLKKKGQDVIANKPGDNNDLLGGGGSGGIKPPPMPPAPGQPLGGKSVQQFKQRKFNDLPDGVKVEISMNIAEALFGDNYEITKAINALSDLNPIVSITSDFKEYKTCAKTDKDIEQIMRAYHRDILTVYPTSATSTPPETIYQSVIPVITDITTVITDAAEKADIDNQKLIDAFRTNIQDLNSESRNYETNNGTPERVVERIADKLVKLYRFSKEHEAIIPPNVFKNFSKAYDRAYAIIQEAKNKGVTP